MEPRDEERSWIRRSQEGDFEAYEALVSRYQRMVHALTYRMTGSVADSEDLAQEVFIQAYRRLNSFRGDAKFSSWLYRIGVNTCLNWRKHEQRREHLQHEWAQQDMQVNAADDISAKVQAALLKLPPKQRAAVILTTYDDMSHAEAGRVLGCSETTVSWRVFMARKQLKKWLEPHIGSQ